jgi:hypothetical protein
MEIHSGEQREAEYLPPVSIPRRFLEHVLTKSPSLTQATNTNKIKLVFAAVKETILSNSLKESGIL